LGSSKTTFISLFYNNNNLLCNVNGAGCADRIAKHTDDAGIFLLGRRDFLRSFMSIQLRKLLPTKALFKRASYEQS
jgi:hypothetical protein